MRKPFILALFVGAMLSPALAQAQTFSFSVDNDGAGYTVPDEGILVAPLFMDTPDIPEILTIELQINGLVHDTPMDLDIYLIDPFGNSIEIMTDRGDMEALTGSGLNLTFSDDGIDLPDPSLGLDAADYKPEGLANGSDNGFATFLGRSGGTDAWILLVIDDAAGDTGSFDSYTLRGTFVPEPVTLSLLALGAIVTLRRKRR